MIRMGVSTAVQRRIQELETEPAPPPESEREERLWPVDAETWPSIPVAIEVLE